MNDLMNPESVLRGLDSDLAKLGSDDFIRVMYAPESSEKLSLAVNYLIDNWPSSEAIQSFKKHMMDSKGGIRGDESETLKKMESVNQVGLITDYKAGKQELKNQADLFVELFRYRPTSTRLKEFYGTSEELGPVAEAAHKIRRHH